MVKFIFGRELTEEDEFFDREDYVNVLLSYINRRQPVAILAPRRMGKSSLLNYIKIKLGNEYIVAKISLEGITSIEEFADELTSKLVLEALSKSLKMRAKNTISSLVASLNQFLGSIKSLSIRMQNLELYIDRYSLFKENKLKPSEILDDVLLLPQRIAEDTGKNVVIMIDEFQKIRVLKQPFPKILELTRKRLQESKNVEIIVSGSETGIIEEMITEAKEPFYNYFKIERLKSFDKETSIRFLNEGLKGKCKEYYEKVYELTEGIPAWLNLAGLIFERECNIEAILEDPNVEIELKKDLEGLTKNEIKVLKGLAKGNKLSEIKVSNIYRVIKILKNRGLVDKINDEYKIIDPILSFYLKK
ncbi:ATP-binding protein [Saccharolobus solfataricus]|uniref:ATPase domain-containing protein n=3 Tax=Saccharolobus solfataricus TaxID=2287 RepID=Q7LX94_SACS2|nr:ATP-binding protein [Saccharolobus solfataricus]AAK42280.1 Conserved hypothetical protein [Saccharolobus solfataricus P2]AKA74893.1 ATP-binding protein [Saccharolobus solfataricus]AKA77589.1 ATP-binding protein [Saccharolobus solfataricus]AKA80279.1 ATP-binding protein [Saccharolobus solfataricus]AZF69357.1 ATP-binding protein [Saccharolobus solfataricus]